MNKTNGAILVGLGLIFVLNSSILISLSKNKWWYRSLEKRIEKLESKMDLVSETFSTGLEDIKHSEIVVEKKYSSLLEEEKKARVDTAGIESSAVSLEKEGDQLFLKKRYSDAYKKYVQVLAVNPENNGAREKKIRSLYYSNPMNSSNYGEILRDCAALKSGGGMSLEIEKIEKAVLEEKGQVAQAGDKTND